MSDVRQVALVTGGSRGIGQAICLELARNGYNIAINYAGNEEKALETKALCEEAGASAIIIKADVSKNDEVEAMMKQVMDLFSRIDVLVNNAGITKDGLLIRMKEDEFDDVIDINLKGSYLCMKHVTKIMMKQRYGRIINMSSVVGIYGNPGQINYAASKAGIIGITKSLAKEIGSRSITVNAIAPGFIETDMTASLTEEYKSAISKQIAVGRLGQVEDIAKAVLFFASKDAGYITGQVLAIDGGMTI